MGDYIKMIKMITLFLGSFLFIFYSSYYLLMIRYSGRNRTWEFGEFLPTVSVIIPTYNEEATIVKKLENTLKQDYPKELMELVIIDSGSTDETVNLVEKFSADNPITKLLFLREKERKGKSHALNIAYSKASGDIKIISDADALLDNKAIKQIVRSFKDPQIGAVTGRQILINPKESSATKAEQAYGNIYEILRVGESIMDSTPIFRGELSAYRADLIELLPENDVADDSKLANMVRKKGYRAVCDANAIFYEYAAPSFKGRFIQKVRRGQGLIRIFLDYRDMLFRPKYGKYGLIIMPIEFFMHIISPFLFVFFLIGLFSTLFYTYSSLVIYLVILLFLTASFLVYLGNKISKKNVNIIDFATSFLSSQFMLLMGLIYWLSGRSLHKWQKIEEIREKWRAES